MSRIGILAIHGSVAEHAASLQRIGLQAVEVRAKEDFKNLDGFIIPGGESTTICDLVETYGLKKEILKFAYEGNKPVLGTCAGIILLARWELLDIEVERNAYGRQLASFEADIKIKPLKINCFPGVFIRAPRITKVQPKVEILAEHAGDPILVRQDNVWGATFHPELAENDLLHKLIFT
jgi:5'-phosphate synthase pdxT subunit